VKLVFSDSAKQDLEEISDYIARDSPKRAVAFIRALKASAAKLLSRPAAFAILPRYAHLGIRHKIHGAYMIFYRIEPDRVSIVRILHSARDYDALLGQDEDQ
jgi:toxin ParE1/3/4